MRAPTLWFAMKHRSCDVDERSQLCRTFPYDLNCSTAIMTHVSHRTRNWIYCASRLMVITHLSEYELQRKSIHAPFCWIGSLSHTSVLPPVCCSRVFCLPVDSSSRHDWCFGQVCTSSCMCEPCPIFCLPRPKRSLTVRKDLIPSWLIEYI